MGALCIGLIVGCQPNVTSQIAGPSISSGHVSGRPVTGVTGVTGVLLLKGKPVKYFGVVVTENYTRSRYATAHHVASRDGRFLIATKPGTYDIVFAGPGFARQVVAGQQVIANRATNLGKVSVDRGYTVGGMVTDEQGAPMSNVNVTFMRSFYFATDDLANSAMGNHVATTGSDGRYVIEDVKRLELADFDARISATVDGSLATGTLQLPDGALTQPLILRPVGTIEGIVVGAHVDEYDWPGAVAESVSDPRMSVLGSSELDGTFRIENVPHGDYRVRLSDGSSAAVQVSVTAGTTTNVTLHR
jgi:hypothetical protein